MTLETQNTLLQLLNDGRPHPRGELETAVQAMCGERPYTTLSRDLRALRQSGWRIAYSRRKGVVGYYLQHPSRVEQLPKWSEPLNRQYIALIQALSPAEKVARAMASAEFILAQRRLLLAEEHPNWSAGQIDQSARQIVYRAQSEEARPYVHAI